MVAKTKGAKSKSSLNMISGECSDASGGSGGGVSERTDLRLSVSRIRMSDYETYHHNKEKLKGMISKKKWQRRFNCDVIIHIQCTCTKLDYLQNYLVLSER